ncbi:MAG: class I SAM-dependent methyltransferase [Magnetococcales bacterium]|nr:class I SAM-dependent methyltransferase [Magnetococcales bacterium]
MDDLFENVPCPLCGTQDTIEIRSSNYPDDISKTELLKIYSASSDQILLDSLASCKKCGLIRINPRVKREVIVASYVNAVDPVFIEQNPQRIATFYKTLKDLTAKMGITPAQEKRVLDIGCAGGAFPKAANDLGFSVVGVEPSHWLAQQARSMYELDIRQGVVEEQNFSKESFDIITLWDVIEHLTNPGAVIDHINSLLKKDGILVVNYPDHDSWARRIFASKWPFFLSVHLFYFTPRTITSFLGKHGFEVVEISPYWQTLQLGYVLQRAAQYFRLFGWVGSLVQKLGIANRPITYNMGQTLVVAKKIV